MTDDLGTQILASVNQMRADLTGHMKDEGQEIKDQGEKVEAIRADLAEWRFAAEQRHHEAMAASERRHSALIQSLGSYQDDVNAMRKAFLVKEGQPDYDGHHDDHKVREQRGSLVWKWITDGFGHMVKLSMAGGALWFMYAVWDALHKGPK